MVLAAEGVKRLLAWAAGLGYDDVPETARRRMALIMADDIAAILSAQDEPEVFAFHKHLRNESSRGEATLLRAGGPKVEARSAALGNGLAASWNEMDEGYRKSPCHAGIYLLPALFAVAERDGLSLREVMRAGIGAYEITARFARAWRSIMPPLHPHGIFNSVGAAAAVGLARKLDAERLLLAVTGATTMVSPGPYNHAIKGALVRNAWAAAGAQTGMLAVELAEAGIGGFASSPYDVYASCFHAETDAAQLTNDLGAEWAVCDGYHKLYACCQYAHASLEALAELLARRPELKGGERVASIVVETDPRGMTLDNYQPATTLAAKFSMPHAVAAALVYGDAGVGSFSSASLADPRVSSVRKKITMQPHPDVRPWPLDRPGRVTLVLEHGEKLSAGRASARGGPDQPFADQEIQTKIQTLSAHSAPGLLRAAAAIPDVLDTLFSAWMASIFK
jgi:2-methylcitrate dehydratase PrpD